MNLNVLTTCNTATSYAFNQSLISVNNILKNKRIFIRFYTYISDLIFKCDAILINSNFFRSYWKNNKAYIFNFLDTLSAKKIDVYWFDTTDSNWCTQFEVMPYVKKFLKSYLLKNKSHYINGFKTGRIFTDFFDSIYNTGEKEENYPLLKKEFIPKLHLSWSSFFEQYDKNRFSLSSKLRRIFPLYIPSLPIKFKIQFTSALQSRKTDLSARFGLSYSRPSLVKHRQEVLKFKKKFIFDNSRLSYKAYFAELQSSKISVSPFGLGKFCYRDYESIVAGACLLKPDMSHLETWPDLY